MTPSPLLKERILAAARSQPSRTREEGKRRALIVYAVALLLAVLVFEWSGGVEHSSGRPLEYTLAIAFGSVVIAAVASWFLLWPGRSLGGRPRSVLVGVVIAIPALTLAWLTSWHGAYLEPFARVGYRCLSLSLVTGGALLTASFLLRRRTLPTNAGTTGAAMAAACSAYAGILIVLWCPLTNAPHACVGHVLPMVLLSCVGALVGQRLLPPLAR